MPRSTDRPAGPEHRSRSSALTTATFALALAGVAASGCSAGTRPATASAGPTTPEPAHLAAPASATTPGTTPALRKVSCPVAIEWVDCGEVSTDGRASSTFVAVVHSSPGDRAVRDAAVAEIDAAIDHQRAIAASVAPNGADPLAALGPVMRITQLQEERAAILAAA